LVLAFFGLTPSYKNILLEEIHTLCYFGQGGFTYDEVYSMPIRYRHYHLKKVIEHLEKQAEVMNKSFTNDEKTKTPLGPPLKPDFTTKPKAPKK